MTEITPDELRQFAEAVGWKDLGISGHVALWHRPGCQGRTSPECECDYYLPDFLTSKDSVIEALAFVCKKLRTNAQITLVTRPDGTQYYQIAIGDAAEYYGGSGGNEDTPTLNAAIIRAVNSAAKSEAKHED